MGPGVDEDSSQGRATAYEVVVLCSSLGPVGIFRSYSVNIQHYN